MKLFIGNIIALLFLIFWHHPEVVNVAYYVDPTNGNDANNGFTTSTAWKTAAKVNSFTFQAGDSILLKGGDSLVGTVDVKYNFLHFDSYGTGLATISAFKHVLPTLKSGNVYAATITDAAANLNMVYVDGTPRRKAKDINNDTLWHTYSDTTSTDTSLVSRFHLTQDYTGKQIVVKTAHYIIDVRTVSHQNGDTLFLNSRLTYTPNIGANGYFFQNDSSYVDSAYEWSMQGNRLNIYLGSQKTVWYAAYDTAVRLKKVRGVTFKNLNIVGANKVNVQFDTSNFNSITYCNISNCGKNNLSWQHSDTNTFRFNTVKNAMNNFALLRDTFANHRLNLCGYNRISRNVFDSCGIYPGMGLSDNGNYIGLYWMGFYNYFDSNVVMHTGYHGMYFGGHFDTARYNFFDWICLSKNDGAGMYTWNDGKDPSNDGGAVWPHDWDTGTYWAHNIALNCVGNTSGTNPNSAYAGAGSAAYYTDFNANSINIEYSTGAYCFGTVSSFGVGAHDDTIKYNTFYNVNQGKCRDLLGTNATIYNTLILGNIFYVGDSSHPVIYDGYKGVSAASITADSNYYCSIAVDSFYQFGNEFYSFSQYRSALPARDVNGGTNPTRARSRVGSLIYNPTLADSTINLGIDTYVDVYGTFYFGTVTLHAFNALILFPSTHTFTKTSYYYEPH